jgi:hypothetical protein
MLHTRASQPTSPDAKLGVELVHVLLRHCFDATPIGLARGTFRQVRPAFWVSATHPPVSHPRKGVVNTTSAEAQLAGRPPVFLVKSVKRSWTDHVAPPSVVW